MCKIYECGLLGDNNKEFNYLVKKYFKDYDCVKDFDKGQYAHLFGVESTLAPLIIILFKEIEILKKMSLEAMNKRVKGLKSYDSYEELLDDKKD